jgi:hypothetical protein
MKEAQSLSSFSSKYLFEGEKLLNHMSHEVETKEY